MKEKEILPLVADRLGITELNAMQRRMLDECPSHHNIILLSPTGSGKTLAFALPIAKLLKPASSRLQIVVIAPGRELVNQIASVFRAITPGYKTVALYGGHNSTDETNSLQAGADIIVATPGRLLDHSKRRNIDLRDVRVLVLDEFDKCLELGFESEMKRLVSLMKNRSRTILTSATDIEHIPDFVNLETPLKLSFIKARKSQDLRQIHRVESEQADKLQSLSGLLASLTKNEHIERTIIFANYRESAQRIFDYLDKLHLPVGLYHGALDQHDRETAIIKFANGTTPILVATDLASRGLDIDEVKHIIHYHQPLTEESFIHRNGRTGRGLVLTGDIYLLLGPEESIKEYINPDDEYHYDSQAIPTVKQAMTTLHFSAGKKEKISKADILGFLIKEGELDKNQVGRINVYDRYALAAIDATNDKNLINKLNSAKIKGKKVRISLA